MLAQLRSTIRLRSLLALIALGVIIMAAVSVRDLDDSVRERLRLRAAQHGHSMEAEIRAILTHAVSSPIESDGLALTLMTRFGDLGGVEIDTPSRLESPRAADLTQ